jgi:hypothetical protein
MIRINARKLSRRDFAGSWLAIAMHSARHRRPLSVYGCADDAGEHALRQATVDGPEDAAHQTRGAAAAQRGGDRAWPWMHNWMGGRRANGVTPTRGCEDIVQTVPSSES